MEEPTLCLRTAVGSGCDADLAVGMVAAPNQNGVVMRGFAESVAGEALASWAGRFCAALMPGDFSMAVYEGRDCGEGESFAAQVRRELQEKIGALEAPGVSVDETASALASAASVIESMAHVHDAAVTYGERLADMRFR